jgi:cysteine desulfurase
MQIYLDHSATTPCRAEAIATMQSVLTEQWGNPSSLHEWGQRSATLVEQARMQVASLIRATAESIIFTSGGTEADNLAIFGVAHQYRLPQHLIISAVEHSAIAEPVRFLEERGWQVTRLSVNRQGQLNPEELQAALRVNTVLVSIIYGQSEVGTVQPIARLAEITHHHGALFHTDAVQVAGRLPLDVQSMPVDLLSLSSHKLYGPQGVGALYVRPGVTLRPLLLGGGQEFKLRSGTQAVPILVGFGLAAELAASELSQETQRLIELRDRLFVQLLTIPGVQPTGVNGPELDEHPLHRLPHHVSVILTDPDGDPVNGKAMVRQMNLAGIGLSAGAACQSGKVTPSPILQAMGYGDAIAQSGVRLTLGQATTLADIDWTATVFRQVLSRLQPQPVLVNR